MKIPEGLYKQKNSKIWWTCVKGYRESIRSPDLKEAILILKKRQVAAAEGQPIIKRADTITCAEGFKDLKEHYETHGERNLEEVGYRFQNLERWFKKQPLFAYPLSLTATSKCA
jgi:hypothetical protein